MNKWCLGSCNASAKCKSNTWGVTLPLTTMTTNVTTLATKNYPPEKWTPSQQLETKSTSTIKKPSSDHSLSPSPPKNFPYWEYRPMPRTDTKARLRFCMVISMWCACSFPHALFVLLGFWMEFLVRRAHLGGHEGVSLTTRELYAWAFFPIL
jgi:hypothetical protein